jgi:putative redox protein
MPMEITAYWDGGMRVRTQARGFEIRVDEPPRFGGDDTGPMPTEVFLSSLASCFVLAVRHVARKEGFEPSGLAVRATGTYDGPRFSAIRLEVHSSEPRVRDILDRAATYSYVSNTVIGEPELAFVMADDPARLGRPPRPA